MKHELGVLEPEKEEEEDGLGGEGEGTVGEAARQPLGGRVGHFDEDRVAVALLFGVELSKLESNRVN